MRSRMALSTELLRVLIALRMQQGKLCLSEKMKSWPNTFATAAFLRLNLINLSLFPLNTGRLLS